jgi:DNA primase
MNVTKITLLLESILGKGKTTNKNNVAFHCPFCHHTKPKLEVNVLTQHFHCWVCNVAGKKLLTLFRKLNVDRDKIAKLYDLLEDTNTPIYELQARSSGDLKLPTEFKPLWVMNETSPEFRNAFAYLTRRGITIFDILKYRIGYCETGPYGGKIIVPSFDSTGQLNYFVGRGYYKDDGHKHKNPTISKNIIGFELFINWQLPIILVEGAFDAIAVKRNAIPLFGKTINEALRTKIIDMNVQQIYICLDKDARTQALETANYFKSRGIRVYFVDLNEKDPGEVGFARIQTIIKQTPEISDVDLLSKTILDSLSSKKSMQEIII